mmetsp:Transcript_23406/g.48555  ORF Transcript_23406/g.48555 Transcript_23406/m.48555 type:complete len:508 (+) Transcript_23406:190-1713(+)
MSDGEDCNSLGEVSNASAFSCQSDVSLDEPAFHLLLYESPGSNPGDEPYLQDALRILHKNDTKYKFIEIDLGGSPSCVQENALYSKGAFGSVGKALAKNTSVESIVITSYDDNEEYVGHFLSLFERMKGNRTLRRFELSGFTGEMEQALSKCAELFSEEGSKLDSFQVEYSDISLPLLRRIMTGLANRSSPLENLSMSHCEFEDHCVEGIFSFFKDKPEILPRKLTLVSHCIGHDDNRCSIMTRLLMCQACSLEDLTISDLVPSDDEMVDIATALERNTTLKRLMIDLTNLNMRAYDRIRLLLCDTKNIIATYHSNHTLGVLGYEMRDSKISSYLKLNNKYSDKQLVAAAKIIDAHFAHNFHLGNFDMMKSQVLALLVSYTNLGFRAWEEAVDEESKEKGDEDEGEWVPWEDEDRIAKQMESDEEERDEEDDDEVEGVEMERVEAEGVEAEGDEEDLDEEDVNVVGGDEEKGANNCLTVHFLMVRNIPAFFDYVKPRWKKQKVSEIA